MWNFLSSVYIMLFGFQPDFAALQIIDVLRWGIVIAVGIAFIKLVFESIGKALLAIVIGLIAYTLLDPSTMQQTGLEIVNFLKSGSEHVDIDTINNSMDQVAPIVNEALNK